MCLLFIAGPFRSHPIRRRAEKLTRGVVCHNSHFAVIRYATLHSSQMKRTPTSYLPPIALQDRRGIPIYRQLYDWFRRAITGGQLRPGQRLPSTRNLAAELKISRMPVLGAFEQLFAEGYLETFVGAGTCVARSIPDDTLRHPAVKAQKGLQGTVEKRGPRRISRRGVA